MTGKERLEQVRVAMTYHAGMAYEFPATCAAMMNTALAALDGCILLTADEAASTFWLHLRTSDGREGSMRNMRYNDDTDTPEAYLEWDKQAGAGDWVPMEDEDGNWLVHPSLLTPDERKP